MRIVYCYYNYSDRRENIFSIAPLRSGSSSKCSVFLRENALECRANNSNAPETRQEFDVVRRGKHFITSTRLGGRGEITTNAELFPRKKPHSNVSNHWEK